MIQRGDHWMNFFPFFSLTRPYHFDFFYLFITSSLLTSIIQPHKLVLFDTQTHFDPDHVLRQPIRYSIHIQLVFVVVVVKLSLAA